MSSDFRGRCVVCFVVILVSTLAGCFGDGPEPEDINITGVIIYHPDLLEWLSDEFIDEHNVTPNPELAVFVPGPEEADQTIHKIYGDFRNPWAVNGTFRVSVQWDSYQLKGWAFSRHVDLDRESIANVSEFDNLAATIPALSAIVDNHTVGTSVDGSIPFISFDKRPSFWNDVWIKGVALDTETVLNWSVFRPELVGAWEEFSSSLLPFDVGGMPDHLVLAETVKLVGEGKAVQGEVLADVTPYNHLEESLRIMNTPLDTGGTRYMIGVVARTQMRLVVLGQGEDPSDAWWVLMPYKAGSGGLTGTVSLDVSEANVTMVQRDLGLEFAGPFGPIPHVGVSWQAD